MAEPDNSWEQLPGIERIQHYLSAKGLDLPPAPKDIQAEWSVPFMRWVTANTTSGIEATLQPTDEPGIRIGTHRDIVCDPALYNMARFDAGLNTTHIVLGSNLARLPWVKALLVANKAIFIDRSLTGRAAFDQHIAISERIAKITDQGGQVWIAQAPGRSKEGRDETHVGLLKMLAKARGGDRLGPQVLSGLVRPLVIRYDVNPCDMYLVKERILGTKTEKDDERSMRTGLEGWKGTVRIAEGPSIDADDCTNDRTGWESYAYKVDHAMEAMNIEGQWAGEANQALEFGDFSILSDGFLKRIECIGESLEEAGNGLDPSTLKQMACEIYREGSTRLNSVPEH